MAAGVDLGSRRCDAEIAFVGADLDAFEGEEVDGALRDLGAGIGGDAGLLEQFAPRGLGVAFAGIDRAAGGAPERRAVVRA